MRLGVVAVATALMLAGCGGDGPSDELSQVVEEAGADIDDFSEEEIAAGEEALEALDLDLELPDDFPEEVPLPEDAWVTGNLSGEGNDRRFIELGVASAESIEDWVERYRSELPAAFEIEEEVLADSAEEARELAQWGGPPTYGRWSFSGQGWDEGTVTVVDAVAWLEDFEADGDEYYTEAQVKNMVESLTGAQVAISISVSRPAD